MLGNQNNEVVTNLQILDYFWRVIISGQSLTELVYDQKFSVCHKVSSIKPR